MRNGADSALWTSTHQGQAKMSVATAIGLPSTMGVMHNI